MTACLDTHYLIWGVQRQAKDSQHDMVERTRAFLCYLEKQRVRIIIPAPVLWEFLSGIPPERRPDTLELLQRSWRIVPFDAMAAVIAADLWSGLPSPPSMDPGERVRMKVDLQIIATAIRHGADIVFSEEKRMRGYAQGRIEVSEMVAIPVQSLLFREQAQGHGYAL